MKSTASELQRTEPASDGVALIAPRGKLSGWRRWGMMVAAILLVCVVAARGIRKGEFDYNVDEAQHAVTGLFMADVFRDLPLRHPVQYAFDYYAQYPAIAIVHWPPLFYLAEGLSFLALGASAFSARLTVLGFVILLLYQWFLLLEEMQDSYTAAIGTAVLGLLPLVLLFEKTVMLEVPSLALGVAAIRSWLRYLDDGSRRWLYAFGLWLSAALLCKQTMIFLPLFCVLTLIVTKKWDRIRTRDAWLAATMITVLVGPFYLLMLISHGRSVAGDLGSHQITGWERIIYYLRVLPAMASLPLLGLSALGLALIRRWDRSSQATLMLCWVAAAYLTFTLFGQREPRFVIYMLPSLVYFAVGFLARFFEVPKIRVAMRGVALLTVGLLTAQAWAYERPYISGYRDAAASLVDTYHSGIVLFDGRVPGNFVFYMRALDPRRQFLVLRKSLYVSDIRQNQNTEELLHSQDELLELFKRDGIRFVVVLDGLPLQFNSQHMLREALHGDQFRLLQRIPITTNEPHWKTTGLLLYENTKWAPPADKFLKIRMMTLNHDIIVPLDRFDFVRNFVRNPAPQTGKE